MLGPPLIIRHLTGLLNICAEVSPIYKMPPPPGICVWHFRKHTDSYANFVNFEQTQIGKLGIKQIKN